MDLRSLKRVPQRQKDLVAGYLKEYQAILLNSNENNPYYNIPELLTFVTLSFYAVIEYFEIIAKDEVELSNDDCTVTKISDDVWGNTSYGTQTIDPLKHKGNYKWSIKIEKMQFITDIGFACNTNEPKKVLYGLTPHYTLDCKYGCVEGIQNSLNYLEQMPRQRLAEREDIKDGDIICLEFNVDGDDSYIAFSRKGAKTNERCIIDAKWIVMGAKYRLAVSMHTQGDSIAIVEFNCK